jgi:hypothetical protein
MTDASRTHATLFGPSTDADGAKAAVDLLTGVREAKASREEPTIPWRAVPAHEREQPTSNMLRRATVLATRHDTVTNSV